MPCGNRMHEKEEKSMNDWIYMIHFQNTSCQLIAASGSGNSGKELGRCWTLGAVWEKNMICFSQPGFDFKNTTLMIKSIVECALFSSTACLVINLIFISWQIQGKALSCEWFHKAEMEPVISAARRAKLTKTPHIMSKWLIIRRHMLELLRWKRMNKRSHAAVILCSVRMNVS